MSYDLSNPPLRAPLPDHAQAITAIAHRVAFRTLERWGLEMPILQKKRQPTTAEVWAACLARMPEADHDHFLQMMPEWLRAQVIELFPAALAFLNQEDTAA